MTAPAVPARPAAPPSPQRGALAQLLIGNQIQQAIHVAARLGIADLLADGPLTSDALAAAAGAHPGALYRLLRALAGLGLLAEDDARRFALTPLGALLQSASPRSVRAFALWSGGVGYQAFGGLEETVRTGRPAFERLFGMEFFAYLASHPESGAVFDEMMALHTAPLIPAIAERDLAGARTVADLGGGRGELLAAVLRAHPEVDGVLVEQARVLDGARDVLARAGVAQRCATWCGDIRDAVPAADAYILKSVLHGLSDADAGRVLARCRRALRGDGMPGGGLLLVVELVIPPGNEPAPAKLMDLLMLVGCHGRERTEEELGALLAGAGFRVSDVAPARYGYSVIEARPA